MKLFLFDIDGTLIKTYGSGRVAVERSLSAAFSQPIDTTGIPFGGKTDVQIFREVLQKHSIADSAENLETCERVYQNALYTELPAGRFEVLSGIHNLLNALQNQAHLHLSLLTGNLIEMAKLKMQHGNLAHFFNFEIGAFGSDAEHRNELPHIAHQKAKKQGIHPTETWIIGDTPKDIECAKVGNCKCLAVATGNFDEASLSVHQPDYLVPNLQNTEQILQIFNLSS